MLTLIEREFDRLLAMFVVLALFTAVIVVVVCFSVVYQQARPNTPPVGIPAVMVEVLWVVMFVLPLFSAVIGSGQMYSDRHRGISTFLSTLATTRHRILAARVIAGTSMIVASITAIAVTEAILLKTYPRIVPIDTTPLTRIVLSILFLSLACYAIGLQTGWSTSRFLPFVGLLAWLVVAASIVLMKGIQPAAWTILAVLTVGSMVRTWQKYVTSPL